MFHGVFVRLVLITGKQKKTLRHLLFHYLGMSHSAAVSFFRKHQIFLKAQLSLINTGKNEPTIYNTVDTSEKSAPTIRVGEHIYKHLKTD